MAVLRSEGTGVLPGEEEPVPYLVVEEEGQDRKGNYMHRESFLGPEKAAKSKGAYLAALTTVRFVGFHRTRASVR